MIRCQSWSNRSSSEAAVIRVTSRSREACRFDYYIE
jgi:hypothetical protein